VIVVVTEDFEVYHDVVGELRDRGVPFTTVEPGAELPAEADVLVTGADDAVELRETIPHVAASPGGARSAVEEALALLRGEGGRTVVGIDPGDQPGIAVLVDDMVVAAFRVPPERAADVVGEEVADAPDPLVRIGDGARIVGTRIVEDLEDVPVELVDETGTTPYLGAGARGLGDILAAVNIARIEGEPVQSRDVDPTEGELRRIKEQSREQSTENRAIDTALARRVAAGELTIDEALARHRDGRDG